MDIADREIARPRSLVIMNPEGGWVAAIDLDIFEALVMREKPWDLAWLTVPGRSARGLIMKRNGRPVAVESIVATVSPTDLAKLGCHWLESEQTKDAEVAARLLHGKLKKLGYTLNLSEVQYAVREVCLPGPGGDPPILDATLNPKVTEL